MAPHVNRRTLIFLDFFGPPQEVASAASIGGVAQRRGVWGIARFGLAVVAGGASGTKHVKGLGPARRCQACRLLPSRCREGRVPETLPCPLPANQSVRADLGKR